MLNNDTTKDILDKLLELQLRSDAQNTMIQDQGAKISHLETMNNQQETKISQLEATNSQLYEALNASGLTEKVVLNDENESGNLMVNSFENKLIPSDSYSFMMVAIMFSKTWFLAFCVCVLQLCMYAFVLIEQLDSQTGEFIALIVGTNVSIAQYKSDKSLNNRVWWRRIGIPCLLKFSQGLLGTMTTMLVILQSTTVLGLFKDFTSLVFIGTYQSN